MSFRFKPGTGLIVVRADVTGPVRRAVLRLALDTGSTHTVLTETALASVGVLIDRSAPPLNMTTASGAGIARSATIDRFESLGQTRTGFRIITHAIPKRLQLDGLLGLDFLRNHKLTIDFNNGTIELT